jgi:hypothetical protein
MIKGTFKDGVIIPDAPLHCENGTRLYIGHLQKEEDYPYWFRDPVHGFIRVSAKEKKIIDHPYFQRLRRIKQLGMTHYVYHGAEHNRFGHSLGVMELATRAIDLLWEKHASLLQWMPLERRYIRQLVRLAALLHDLGHPPFSHVAESLLPEKNQLPGGKPNEAKPAKHEDYTRAILLHSELKDYIEKLFADIQLRAEDVWALIKGTVVKYPFPFRENFVDPAVLMTQLISGELDVDRMDYLLRDSLYCGVAYGKFDVDRLISCLTINMENGNAELAIEDGGVYAVEGLLIARYHMFLQVYFHDIRRIYDYILTKYLASKLPGGKFPADLDNFLKLDDSRVESWITEDFNKNEWANRLYYRRHLKLLRETAHHPSKGELEFIQAKKKFLESKGIRELYLDDGAEGILTKLKPMRYTGEEERKIYVIGEHGEKVPLQERSKVIEKINEEIKLWRLYCHEDDVLKADKILKEELEVGN